MAILAHSHLAHTPKTIDQSVFTDPSSAGLPAQLESVIEALDAVKQSLQPKNIVLVGHSLGGWLCLQVRPSGVVLYCKVFRFSRHLKPALKKSLAPFYSSLRYAMWRQHQTGGSYL